MKNIRELNKFIFLNIFFLILMINCKEEVTNNIQKNIASSDIFNKDTIMIEQLIQEYKNPSTPLLRYARLNEYSYVVKFLPNEVVAFIELQKQANLSDSFSIYSDMRYYSDLLYFQFRIYIEGEYNDDVLKYQLSNLYEYQQRIAYILSNIEKDFYLIQNKDTIYPALFHWERSYNIVPFITFSLAFEKRKVIRGKDFIFIFEDNLFKQGKIQYYYPYEFLSKFPAIKI